MSNEVETLQDLLDQHIMRPHELETWLKAFADIMAQDENPDLSVKEDVSGTTFSLTVLAQNARDVFENHVGDAGALRIATESLGTFLVSAQISTVSINQIPKTQEMVSIAKHYLPNTDAQGLTPIVPKLRVNPPRTALGELNAIINIGRGGRYPRTYADILSCLEPEADDHAVYADPASVPTYATRELVRIATKEYIALPNDVVGMIPPEIYARETPHLAIKGSNAGKVAYTESHKKGLEDVQSVMKPGKYIRRVLKDKSVNDQQLKEMVAEMNSQSTLEFHHTTLPGDARDVYTEGPDSCLKPGKDRFSRTYDADGEWRHPIEALFFEDGTGDLELIYGLDHTGRPAARTLACPSSEEYVKIYAGDWMPGARSLIQNYLDEQGYSQSDDALDGLRIPAVHIDGNLSKVLCPYIDPNNLGVNYSPGDDIMVIGGPHEAPYDHGFIDLDDDEDRTECDECHDDYDDDEIHELGHLDMMVCDGCLDDEFIFALDDDRVARLFRHDDCEPTNHPVDDNFGREVSAIAPNVADFELPRLGLCRVANDEIYSIDDCYRREDVDEWVHEDDVALFNSGYDTGRGHEYMALETDGVHPVEDCVFINDEAQWIHHDEFDDRYSDDYVLEGDLATPKEKVA